jgi:hypothetical protein
VQITILGEVLGRLGQGRETLSPHQHLAQSGSDQSIRDPPTWHEGSQPVVVISVGHQIPPTGYSVAADEAQQLGNREPLVDPQSFEERKVCIHIIITNRFKNLDYHQKRPIFFWSNSSASMKT